MGAESYSYGLRIYKQNTKGMERIREQISNDPRQFSEVLNNLMQRGFSIIGQRRFAYRLVWFDSAMAKSFYKIPEKEIKSAAKELLCDGILIEHDNGFMLSMDAEFLESYSPKEMKFVYAIDRNDILYKSQEHTLKEKFSHLYEHLGYDHGPLQYLLIDGEFHGASVGHFRNGLYDLNDVVCDLPAAEKRMDEIIEAIKTVNFGQSPKRFMGNDLQI